MDINEFKKLHTNQLLLVEELKKRGIKIWVLDDDTELIEAQLGNHHEFILDRYSSIIPYNLRIITNDKYLTKYILSRNNLSVTNGRLFDNLQIDQACEFSEKTGFPVVLKPNYGSHADNIYMNIMDLEELKKAISDFFSKAGDQSPFFIEKQFEAKEYRIFITEKGDYAILHREPAHVIGDGISNINKLIEVENSKRMSERSKKCIYPIKTDDDVINNLLKQQLKPEYTPAKNQKVYLRFTSNIAKGGICMDYTDNVHSSVIKIGKQVLSLFKGLPYIGLDMLSKDISMEQNAQTYQILEVNANPGFTMHMKPALGQSRNVASFVADLIFPETAI